MRTNHSISYSMDSSFDELFEESLGYSGSINTDLESVVSKEQISAWNKIKDGMKQSQACFSDQKNPLENLNSDLTENSLVEKVKDFQQKLTNEGCNGCAVVPNGCAIVPVFIRDYLKLDQGNGDDLVCGRVSDESGNTYTGQLEEGKPNGFGKMIFAKTGDQYEGYWKSSRPHGPGHFVRADGGEFEGEWLRGKLHLVKEGVACVTDRRGNKYDGSFKNWKKHGYGTFTKVNGEKYSGYYVDDQRNGYGVLTYADGSGFEGVFYNDEATNQGHSICAHLDNADTISTLSVNRDNSMHLPEADKGNSGSNEEIFVNNDKKSNRKFLKNLRVFTRKTKSKDDDTLDNTLPSKTELTYRTVENNENNAGENNTLKSIENKGKKFGLTPKKLFRRTPKKKSRDTNMVLDGGENIIHQI